MADQSTHIPTLDPVVFTAADGGPDDACEVCKRTGLAILPTRYAVVPAACQGALEGVSPSTECLTSIADEGYKYVLRTLRKGYLYLFFEDGPEGTDYYEAYSVAENGTLWPEPSAAMVRGIVGGGVPTCRRSGHSATRTEFIVIGEPEACGTVWMAYSQHRWRPDMLDRYASDAALRARRMQPIEPSRWVASPAPSGDIGAVTTSEDIKQVVEYHTHRSVIGEPPGLPHHLRARRISRADGSFDRRVLHTTATRYPWWLRNQQTLGDPEPDISVHTTWQQMRGASPKGGGQHHVPMLVALQDPIGITHELNGYRSDVLAHLARYHDELALELNAMEHVGEIELLLQNNAVAMSDARMRTVDALRAGSTYEQGLLRPSEAGLATEHAPLEQRFLAGEIEFAQYRSQRSALISRHADSTGSADLYGRPAREARIAELERLYGRQDGWRQRQAALPADHWDRFAEDDLARRRAEATRDWNQKYRPLIDWPRYTAFKANADAFLTQVHALLEERSRAVAKWLRSERLWTVLEDYSGTSIECGLAFENVIIEAIAGLAGDAEGLKVLRELAANLAVTEPGCLLWRVIALNQTEARSELEKALQRAEAEAGNETDGTGAAWARFVLVADSLKRLKKYYELAEKVNKDTTASARLVQEAGVDRFVVNAGALLLNRFPLKGVNLTVGHAIARLALAQRALMDPDEAVDLIQTQARHEAHLRRRFFDRVSHYRAKYGPRRGALTLALADLEREQGYRLLRERWAAVSTAGSPLKLAGLTAVLEVVNFAHLLQKTDKGSKEYAQLLAAGLSTVSVYASVSTAINKEFFGATSRSYANAQALGSALGGAASLIGAFVDLSTGMLADERGRGKLATLYYLKSTSGIVVGLSQLVTALSYSAPLIRSVTGRNATVLFLEMTQASIAHASKVSSTPLTTSRVMRNFGRTLVRLGGWQVTLAIVAMEGCIWMMSPNALEEWCEKNHLAKRTGSWLGPADQGSRYKTPKEQSEAFEAAVQRVLGHGDSE